MEVHLLATTVDVLESAPGFVGVVLVVEGAEAREDRVFLDVFHDLLGDIEHTVSTAEGAAQFHGHDGVIRCQMFIRAATSKFGEHEPAREHVVVGESASTLAGRVGGMVAVEIMFPSEVTKQPVDRVTRRDAFAKLSEIDTVQPQLNDSVAVKFESGREIFVSEPSSGILDLL